MGGARPRRRRQRALATILGLSGLAVLAVLAWMSWGLCVEHWYIAKLGSGDREARERAVVRLGELASARAVPYLIEAIAGPWGGNEEPFDEDAQARELGYTLQVGFVSVNDPQREPTWSRRCSRAIGTAGIKALPGLEQKLRSRNPVERLWAAHQIGRLAADAAAASGDLFLLLSDEDPRVRRWSARAMGEIASRSPGVLRLLGDGLRSRENPRELRERCLEGLVVAGRTPVLQIRYASAGNGAVRFLNKGLFRAGEPTRETLETASMVLATLVEATGGKDDDVRGLAGAAFFTMIRSRQDIWLQGSDHGFDLERALLGLASDPDATLRAHAIGFLAHFARADGAALSALSRALHDPAVKVRINAVDGLRALGELALPAWRAALGPDQPVAPDTLSDALAAMGAGARPFWHLLNEMLPRAEGDSISGLARALGRIGAASGIGVAELTTALKSSSAGARRGAAEALGYYGVAASGAGPALLEALDDEDRSVRVSAAFSIVSTRGVPLESLSEKAVPILAGRLDDEDPAVRRRAGEALGALGPAARAAVPALGRALKNQYGQINDWALIALGAIGPEAGDAVPAVLSLISADDGQDLRDAFHAIKAIGREPDLVIPALRRFLVEPHDLHSPFAADSLSAFGERAVPALIEALSSESQRIRGAAMRSLGDLGPAGKTALPALQKAAAKDPQERLQVQAWMAIQKIDAVLAR